MKKKILTFSQASPIDFETEYLSSALPSSKDLMLIIGIDISVTS
jgi:hypothetical protein